MQQQRTNNIFFVLFLKQSRLKGTSLSFCCSRFGKNQLLANFPTNLQTIAFYRKKFKASLTLVFDLRLFLFIIHNLIDHKSGFYIFLNFYFNIICAVYLYFWLPGKRLRLYKLSNCQKITPT